MNRTLFAMALGLGMMGLMGCATGVDDPVPQAPAPEEQRDPPSQALSGELRDPQQQLLSGIGVNQGFSEVPVKMVHQGPLPTPE
jgi:hypothetical protein